MMFLLLSYIIEIRIIVVNYKTETNFHIYKLLTSLFWPLISTNSWYVMEVQLNIKSQNLKFIFKIFFLLIFASAPQWIHCL
jgi:hypothetical protein